MVNLATPIAQHQPQSFGGKSAVDHGRPKGFKMSLVQQAHAQGLHGAANAVAAVSAWGAFVHSFFNDFIPVLAAIMSCVWFGLEIYESTVVQKWLLNRAARRAARAKPPENVS